MKHTLHRVAAAALLAGSAMAAHADNVMFSGYANGSQFIDFTIVSTPAPVHSQTNAGGFATTLNGGPSFTSFCVDLYDHISFGQTYSDYTAVPGSAHAWTNPNADADLSRLFTSYGAVSTASSTNSAAFQTAVWEIAYETSGSYDLAAGNARFTGDAGSISQASIWLANLGTIDGVDLTVLESVATRNGPGHQDVVFSTAVPEPGTYALTAAGLAAMAFVSRRRKPV